MNFPESNCFNIVIVEKMISVWYELNLKIAHITFQAIKLLGNILGNWIRILVTIPDTASCSSCKKIIYIAFISYLIKLIRWDRKWKSFCFFVSMNMYLEFSINFSHRLYFYSLFVNDLTNFFSFIQKDSIDTIMN